MESPSDMAYMSLALALAARGRGTTSPNPMVGCVILKNGRMIGQGFHVYAGGPHAEIVALTEAGEAAQGATLIVTLEPCCHHGRTPPCTDAIIKAGIQHVIVATKDPNPLMAGKGIAALKNAGITVTEHVMTDEANALNVVFNHYITHKTPYVTAKWAMSLDGQTITHPDDTRQITEIASLTHAHTKRSLVDAVLIGANTARTDNPQLTARDPETGTLKGKQPRRLILSANGDLPLHLRLLNKPLAENTWVITSEQASPDFHEALQKQGVKVIIAKTTETGEIYLPALMETLGQHEITSLLVEGGMTTLRAFFKANLVHAIDVYLAPVIIGDLTQKKFIHLNAPEALGRDFYLSGEWHV